MTTRSGLGTRPGVPDPERATEDQEFATAGGGDHPQPPPAAGELRRGRAGGTGRLGRRGGGAPAGRGAALDEGRYALIAGERRWRAAKRAGLSEIPAMVRSADDQASLTQALIENLQRQDLSPLEEAAAFQELLEEHGMTHEQVAGGGKEPSGCQQHPPPAPTPGRHPGDGGAGRAFGRACPGLLGIEDASPTPSTWRCGRSRRGGPCVRWRRRPACAGQRPVRSRVTRGPAGGDRRTRAASP
jgi:hypothetical protein